MAEKREMTTQKKSGFSISDLILVAVLLAAGAVLKLTVGTVVNFFGMKPNFIIAMYCLALLLIRPSRIGTAVVQAAAIGIISGAICQLLPGTPWLNFISELLGAVAMSLLIRIPMKIGKLNFSTAVSAFIATIISGSAFVACLFLFTGAVTKSLVAYIPIVFFTALINAVIVQLLYLPLKAVLKK
ncbi:MAG: threonine/serine exporter family protein [Papillibacter sp.]|jgi:hypothetical protein|nr:threonine/serine exporter family protein [Papillibacter sp.]